jgi:hypothetical protein
LLQLSLVGQSPPGPLARCRRTCRTSMGKLVDLVEQTGLVPVIVQDAPEKDAARVRADLVRWCDQASVR